MNRSARGGKKCKASNGLDTALYKKIPFFLSNVSELMKINITCSTYFPCISTVAIYWMFHRKSDKGQQQICLLFSLKLEGARASTGLCVDVGSGVII